MKLDLTGCTYVEVSKTLPFSRNGHRGTISFDGVWYDDTGSKIVVDLTEIETPRMHVYHHKCKLGYSHIAHELSLILPDGSPIGVTGNREFLECIHNATGKVSSLLAAAI